MNYPMQNIKENMARAVARDLPISTKQTTEICNAIRSKTLISAKQILQESADEKKAIPYRRFLDNLGHKKGIGPGRFPNKAALLLIKKFEEVDPNAQSKGLNSSQLQIVHLSCHRAARPWRFGRKRRIKAKRTTVYVVVEESSPSKEGSTRRKPTQRTATPQTDTTKQSHKQAIEATT